jgi:DNA polymerase III subunit chi
MTQIDFYTHVPDKLRAACQLSAKAFSRGMKVTVFCPDPETAHRFDRMLWSAQPTGFVPHCAPDDPLAAETPVIVDCRGDNLLHDEVLINLRPEWPPFFGRFQRLIEIVGAEDDDRATARDRYRFYRDQGYEIRTHDLSKPRDQ